MKTNVIISCPHCKTRVIPKTDGTCPSCQRSVVRQLPKISATKTKAVLSKKSISIVKDVKSSEARNRNEVITEKKKIEKPYVAEIVPQKQYVQESTPKESSSIFCQSCGREAQTKFVSFRQNIGVLVMRFTKSVEGNLCKDCSSKYFWSFTGTTLFLGWWGVISFIVTPFIILNNLFRFLGTLGMDSPSAARPYPTLTEKDIGLIKPYTFELFDRINAGEKLEVIARSVALRAKVSPGQIIVYAFALVQAIQDKKL